MSILVFRLPITDEDGKSIGWFNKNSARCFKGRESWELWRYEKLYLTVGQRYVLGYISCIDGESNRYQSLTPTIAHEWLLEHDHGPEDFHAGPARKAYDLYLADKEL